MIIRFRCMYGPDTFCKPLFCKPKWFACMYPACYWADAKYTPAALMRSAHPAVRVKVVVASLMQPVTEYPFDPTVR